MKKVIRMIKKYWIPIAVGGGAYLFISGKYKKITSYFGK